MRLLVLICMLMLESVQKKVHSHHGQYPVVCQLSYLFHYKTSFTDRSRRCPFFSLEKVIAIPMGASANFCEYFLLHAYLWLKRFVQNLNNSSRMLMKINRNEVQDVSVNGQKMCLKFML